MRTRTAIVLIALVTLALSTPAVLPYAHAASATWTVRAGSSRQSQALQSLVFLPREITINEGDSVQWAIGAADHSIYFPAGDKGPEMILPGKSQGELYWNPSVFFPSPQKEYDGSGPLSGGVIGAAPGLPRTYAVAFTKAGTYKYLCVFHPGMEGTVVVQAAGTALPKTQTEYDKIAVDEARTSLAKAEELYKATKPVATGAPGKRAFRLDMVGSLKEGATFYRFPSDRLEIRRGDSVTWVMKDPTELHTVSFGVGKRPFDIAIPKPQPQGPPKLLVNAATMTPAGGKAHRGSGFYNSGFMLTAGPGVKSYSLTFTRPGEYEYICATHAFYGMKARVVVR
jgi:plastocyanin